MSGSFDRRWSPAAARLVEAVMNAVETIEEPLGPRGLVPAGSPVVSGRVHLGRLRSRLPVDRPVTVLAGFGSLMWLGDPEAVTPPDLGRTAYRGEVTVDRRGRVVLDRRQWVMGPCP